MISLASFDMQVFDASFRPHPDAFYYWTWNGLYLFNMRMNNADIAWMLLSTALVLLMTPALAFFYGGLVRSKNALNTMMMSFVALGPVAVVWALLGYSLAFAPGNPFIGSLGFAGLRGVGMEAQGTIPHLLFMAFQGTFAIITPALISGAVVERMRFNAYLAFIVLWVLRGVCAGRALGVGRRLPGLDGRARFRRRRGRARQCRIGGAGRGDGRSVRARITAVTRSCRTTFRSRCSAPACCGSAGSASTPAARSRRAPPRRWRSRTRCSRPPPTLAAWTLIDMVRGGTVTAVGAATAIVVGLVVVTPAAGYIGPLSAIVMGAIGAVPSYFALDLSRQDQAR